MAPTPTNKTAPKTKRARRARIALIFVLALFCLAVTAFALTVASFVVARAADDNNLAAFGDLVYINTLSDAMAPTISSKDLVVAKRYIGDGSDLEVGQAIVFKTRVMIDDKSYDSCVVLRIAEILTDGGVLRFRTEGEGAAQGSEAVLPDSVLATWGTSDEDGELVFGVGSLSNWLRHPKKGRTRMACVTLLPLFAALASVLAMLFPLKRPLARDALKGKAKQSPQATPAPLTKGRLNR